MFRRTTLAGVICLMAAAVTPMRDQDGTLKWSGYFIK